MRFLVALMCLFPISAWSATIDEEVVREAQTADVVLIGELHDNPHHHFTQAELVSLISVRALVFEMIRPADEDQITLDLRQNATALATALRWEETGWPDFDMYFPIFQAASSAPVFGGMVARDAGKALMSSGLEETFGPQAGAFGLNQPLSDDEQSSREALQFAAHCDALPESMLPMMVDFQRLRDAELARAVIRARDATADQSGSIVVITGNGHAREDWGVPRYLARVWPEANLLTIGQTEEDPNNIDGVFDHVLVAHTVARGDPCEAFRKTE